MTTTTAKVKLDRPNKSNKTCPETAKCYHQKCSSTMYVAVPHGTEICCDYGMRGLNIETEETMRCQVRDRYSFMVRSTDFACKGVHRWCELNSLIEPSLWAPKQNFTKSCVVIDFGNSTIPAGLRKVDCIGMLFNIACEEQLAKN
ncbi:hypothetical protein B566_EDAN011793 [Ephemera danica]|nr:hypothetical protein B566_EDAN011793 [Ephemera danica]